MLLVVLQLVQFHGPDQQIIEINPHRVVTIRGVRHLSASERQHFHPEVRCLIFTTDGKFVGVVEDCAIVRQRLVAP